MQGGVAAERERAQVEPEIEPGIERPWDLHLPVRLIWALRSMVEAARLDRDATPALPRRGSAGRSVTTTACGCRSDTDELVRCRSHTSSGGHGTMSPVSVAP